VDYTETLRRNRDVVAPPLLQSSRDLQWVKLNGDVYGGTTATGDLVNWSASAGSYSTTSNSVTVKDTTGKLFGASGQEVLCRVTYQRSSPYSYYELVWANPFIMATTTSVVSGSTFTVNTSGGSALTVSNWCGWSTVATSGVLCMIGCDGNGGFGFVQGTCGS
jgi:hypothetical protein